MNTRSNRSAAWAVIRLMAVTGMIFVAAGCAGFGAQPWERDLLAEKQMQLEPSAVDAALDAHMYFSKEASSGGAGFGGGGCGCN